MPEKMGEQTGGIPEVKVSYTGPLDGKKLARLADELLSLSVAEQFVLNRLVRAAASELAEFE